MPYAYNPPSFLQGQSADEIHRRMLNALPDNIDKSENQIPWDFTRPAALEKAEFVEFELNETVKIMFPQWAYNEWLDLHAESEGITRRPANRAYCTLSVKGVPGTVIHKGFQFATQANITASVIFEAVEEVTIKAGEDFASIPVQAVSGGTSGNVPPDTIMLMVKPESGVTYITNPQAATGGVPEESDDELRDRLLDSLKNRTSFAGCDADYIRWAKEVPGVGQAIVDAEWDDPNMPEQFHWTDALGQRRCAGAVRLFLLDANGLPANQQILDAVYEHIICPGNREERKAPVGAALTVASPSPLYIDVSAKITVEPGESIEEVTERFKAGLDKYWISASTENSLTSVQSGAAQNSVKYVYVGAVLAETAGVSNYDFGSLRVNGGTGDIQIAVGEYPVTAGVDLYE